jgi:hypothetical protein
MPSNNEPRRAIADRATPTPQNSMAYPPAHAGWSRGHVVRAHNTFGLTPLAFIGHVPRYRDTIACDRRSSPHLGFLGSSRLSAANHTRVGNASSQRLRLGGPFSRRPRNLLEQPRIQASTFWGHPRIALWNTGATDDTVVTANIIHLPLSWCYPMSTVFSLRSRTCRWCHQQYGSPN